VGLDVGSTTVKAVAVEPVSGEVLWRDYRRHETRQPETSLDFLERIEAAFPDLPATAFRIFATGTGGAAVARHIGAIFLQEVNAVAYAVAKLHPDTGSVVELGGQDAKIVVFERDPASGRQRKIPSMNDKCAGGTGAVIDKICAKLNFDPNLLCNAPYTGVKLHSVAGKCGVFAETDITGLMKQGVAPEELMASLFEALVQQNLSVLARGRTLRPKVLLLGGPNFFIRGLQECWRHHLGLLWAERGIEVPPGESVESLVVVPPDAHYFAALGAALCGHAGAAQQPDRGVYLGCEGLRWYLERGRREEKQASGRRGLVKSVAELEDFKARYSPAPWRAPDFPSGAIVEAFLGIDGGSTSTKGVLIDKHRRVLAKSYRLSRGNPISDTKDILLDLEQQMAERDIRLRICGAATTGYAKDVLRDVFGADVALVETVAHTRSGLHHFPNAEVICDVGGQDIKIIIIKNGVVKDFRLNTQCSAGNGYYLQSTAEAFGHDVTEYADIAFTAEAMPEFGYGCAVFMQSDIVDFQRQGWQPNEIMAGLAAVLPKNVWLYVCQIPHLARLGRHFVLQGGTQRNLAAVKAQVDFIERRFQGTGIQPEISVHPHCGESGAIGCAFEAQRLYTEEGHRTSFIGLQAVHDIAYTTQRGEQTRCSFCKNKCVRTFIDVTGANGTPPRRLIISTCEKGAVEAVDEMKDIKKCIDELKAAHPDLTQEVAVQAFRPVQVLPVKDRPPAVRWWHTPRQRQATRHRQGVLQRREELRIGLPRVLNLYAHAPFFMGFFQSLGVAPDNLVWSDRTTQQLYREGAKRGSIDPCYPSKLGIPHVHNLLSKYHERKPLDCIFFPMVDSVPPVLDDVLDARTCPAAIATAEATHAAFTKEGDAFAERGIVFKKTFLNLDKPDLCARQFHEDWAELLGLSEREARRAVSAGLEALDRYQVHLRRQGGDIINRLVRDNRVGLVLLGRPYHSDPGVSHGIGEQFQKLGYPLITQDALPMDDAFLAPLFAGEDSPCLRSVSDVWKHAYLENSSRKLWAAKIVARHPNLVPLELSSFKCGHDAPLYAALEEIIERAGKPYFYFRDIDENRPAGSLRIRTETIDYFLQRYQERLQTGQGHPHAVGERFVRVGSGSGRAAVA
jgi:activator of 2-hydroxyglutaryl-CoA dehydratase/predicted nucleotide-binding protein (sugar kinase/HSP70/actin superfamily)